MFANKKQSVLAVIFVVLTLVRADESTTTVKSEKSDSKRSFSKDCANTYTTTCLKLDIVSWVDNLNENDDYGVFPGVSVVRENGSEQANTADMVAELARDFPNDPDARLDAFLMKKVTGYLNSHSIKLQLFQGVDENTARRLPQRKGGMSGMLLAMAAMMKGTLFSLALGALAALAGKALLTGLISLLLSAIIGLKSLAGGGHKQTTYEIVAKPVYSHSNSHSSSHEEHGGGHGYSGYGRSFDINLPLALQPGYKP